MDSAIKKVLTIVVFFVLMLVFIGIATSIDAMNNAPFIVGLIVVMIVIFVPMAIAGQTSDVYDVTKEKINNKINEYNTSKTVNKDLNTYSESKHNFKYLSDENLLKKYEIFKSSNKFDMERLALEEELVERKLIPYSPMHEKTDKIKSNLK